MEENVPDLVSSEVADLVPELASVVTEETNKARVPVTLITGFLGSGKVRCAHFLDVYCDASCD